MAAPRFLQRILGVATDVAAAVVGGTGSANMLVGTNNAGTIDPTFFPAGIGGDVTTLPASEAIAAGAPVNVWNNGGAANVRNADSGTASAGKAADGFVNAAVSSGANATVYTSGQNTGLTGLTPGALYYLGASGAVTTTPPSTSGTTVQQLGRAYSATVLDMQIKAPIAIT